MLGWTDRHGRYFLRQISQRILLFSEMLAPEAILLGKKEHYLRHHPEEHPVAFQLGGNQPGQLAAAARDVEKAGYDEVNFNVGCPSLNGRLYRFGAHLMKEPRLVADCVAAMVDAVSIPVSVKCRIGVDELDSYDHLAEFVATIHASGCQVFFVHARKAWLEGLTPKENREVPPLRYDYVYRLKRENPGLTIVLNGGITDWGDATRHLEHVDGVMIGRRAYKDPYWLTRVDQDFFGASAPLPSQIDIMRRCIPYIERELAQGTALRDIVRHMVGLYRQLPSSAAFRRQISLEASRTGAGLDAYLRAIDIAAGLAHPSRSTL